MAFYTIRVDSPRGGGAHSAGQRLLRDALVAFGGDQNGHKNDALPVNRMRVWDDVQVQIRDQDDIWQALTPAGDLWLRVNTPSGAEILEDGP